MGLLIRGAAGMKTTFQYLEKAVRASTPRGFSGNTLSFRQVRPARKLMAAMAATLIVALAPIQHSSAGPAGSTGLNLIVQPEVALSLDPVAGRPGSPQDSFAWNIDFTLRMNPGTTATLALVINPDLPTPTTLETPGMAFGIDSLDGKHLNIVGDGVPQVIFRADRNGRYHLLLRAAAGTKPFPEVNVQFVFRSSDQALDFSKTFKIVAGGSQNDEKQVERTQQ